jgi:hypothetical protein
MARSRSHSPFSTYPSSSTVPVIPVDCFIYLIAGTVALQYSTNPRFSRLRPCHASHMPAHALTSHVLCFIKGTIRWSLCSRPVLLGPTRSTLMGGSSLCSAVVAVVHTGGVDVGSLHRLGPARAPHPSLSFLPRRTNAPPVPTRWHIFAHSPRAAPHSFSHMSP